jgi:hypothetical protein
MFLVSIIISHTTVYIASLPSSNVEHIQRVWLAYSNAVSLDEDPLIRVPHALPESYFERVKRYHWAKLCQIQQYLRLKLRQLKREAVKLKEKALMEFDKLANIIIAKYLKYRLRKLSIVARLLLGFALASPFILMLLLVTKLSTLY